MKTKRHLITILILLNWAFAEARDSGGGGGRDRPTPRGSSTWPGQDERPLDFALQEQQRREFCVRSPERCQATLGQVSLPSEQGRSKQKCGDAFVIKHPGQVQCPAGSQLTRLFGTEFWTCQCYGGPQWQSDKNGGE